MFTWSEESERYVALSTDTVRGTAHAVRDCPPGWRGAPVCPADWADAMAACHGSFFHTPPGLRLGGPVVDAYYLTRSAGPRVTALAALTFGRCRLSAAPRHVRLATMPGVAAGGDATGALVEIREWLRASGAADVLVESFDAESDPDPAIGGMRTGRIEFVVPTGADDAESLSRCSRHHQRYIGAGERHGWTFRLLAGREAQATITDVTREASRRADRRGDGFAAPAVPADLHACGSPGDAWGTFTAAAYAGDCLLAAALVGWGGRAGFYAVGGSTPAGYASSAAPWLHWQVLRVLRRQGVRQYNLGGVPCSARDAADPSSGLYRFKSGFGAEPSARTSIRWSLAPRHTRLHTAAQWLATRVARR